MIVVLSNNGDDLIIESGIRASYIQNAGSDGQYKKA